MSWQAATADVRGQQLEPCYLSLPRIGALFGGRDHSTVIHALEKVNGLLRTELPTSGIELEFDSFFFSFLPPAILLWIPPRSGLSRETTLERRTREYLPAGLLEGIMRWKLARLRGGGIGAGESLFVVARNGRDVIAAPEDPRPLSDLGRSA